MDKINLIIPAVILTILVILVMKTITKKNKNLPLKGIERIFLTYCSVTVEVIPEDVTDVYEFAIGNWAIKNATNINWKEVIVNRKDNVLEHIGIEFPSEEHEEFKNKLMIYGDYVSKETFGPNAYVFSSLPELSFNSNTCKKIYFFMTNHLQKNRQVLIKLDYGPVSYKANKFTIKYNHKIKSEK